MSTKSKPYIVDRIYTGKCAETVIVRVTEDEVQRITSEDSNMFLKGVNGTTDNLETDDLKRSAKHFYGMQNTWKRRVDRISGFGIPLPH